jgi:hypothetical protein
MSKEKEKKKMGRPFVYSEADIEEIFKEIFERIATGESLREICRDEKMPDRATVNKWLATNSNLYAQYTKAKELCGEYEFDEIKDITDQEPRFFIDDKGNKRIDMAWVQLQRLRADKRQWRASKLHAKRYGDSTTIKGDPEAPLSPPQIIISSKPLN